MSVKYVHKMVESPVGNLKLVASDHGLAAILWEGDDPRRIRLEASEEAPDHPVLVEAERQLNEYFDGERTSFSLDLDCAGTEFQKQVWRTLLTIPYGETRSYGQIAEQIGHPEAARAVGAANGKNRISIVAPCHRVIGSTGKLTGFAGGLEAKEKLLALEAGGRRKMPRSSSAVRSGQPRGEETVTLLSAGLDTQIDPPA
jgi:methylated-DNA-[protein]-cysteine S-methyltransferase